MLPLPQDLDTLVSVVGFDPGTTTTGVGIITFDLESFAIASCEAYTFNGNKLPSNAWIGATYNERLQRIYALQETLLALLHRVSPIGIACESSYMNVRQPSAYGALMEIVCAIRDAVRAYDAWRQLHMFTPSEGKKAVGAGGGGDKDAVKAAIAAHPDLAPVCLTDLAHMDEHSADGLAIAYCLYKALRDSRFTPLN